MTIKEMKELALCAAKNEAPANYSMENVNDALVEGLREMAVWEPNLKNRSIVGI